MPVKKKPQSMIPFDRNKHAALYYDGDAERFVCVLGYRPAEGGAYAYTEEFTCVHPLEAFTCYEGTFTDGLRLRYGEWLEGIGYHRYSGGKLGPEAVQAPGIPARPGAYCQSCRVGENGSGTCPERYNREYCVNGVPVDARKEA